MSGHEDMHDADALESLLEGVALPDPSSELLLRTREAVADVMGASGSTGADDAVMTPAEVAAFLRVDVQAVMANLAALPAFEFAGHVRFSRSAMERWIREQTAAFGGAMIGHDAARLKIG